MNQTLSLRLLIVSALATAFLLAGCDWTVNEPGSAAGPTLLEVRVFPQTIATGDTALFSAVVADSTDPSLRYEWLLSGISQPVETDTAQVVWIAPNEPGTYDHRVTAIIGTDSLATDALDFSVRVEPVLSGASKSVSTESVSTQSVSTQSVSTRTGTAP